MRSRRQATRSRRSSRALVPLLALVAATACGGDGGARSTGPGRVDSVGTVPPPRSALRKVIENRGLRIGVGAAVGSLFGRTDATGTRFSTVLAREFNVMTAENDMKWTALQPSRGTFRYGRADSMVAFAKTNGMRVRGHTLVWHQQIPSWVTTGSWTTDQARALLDDHITNVVGHFRGQLAAWDVVNEAVADDGTMRSTFWSTAIGPEYVEQAFRTARAADPGVPLFYNDYGIEASNRKSDSVHALLSRLRAKGVPIDGIGFQAHFAVNGVPSKDAMVQTFNRFAALGLRVHITELDVRMPLPATPASLATQAQRYGDVFRACLEVPACEMVVTWGLTDLASWVPGAFAGQGAALLFDETFTPKPAYNSVYDLLDTWR